MNSNRPLRDRQNPGTDWRILPSQGRGTHTTSRQSSWVNSASTRIREAKNRFWTVGDWRVSWSIPTI
jgi:hypothetical protein